MYDTNRPAFLERDLVVLSVYGNWQVWVRYRGGELVPIHTVGKGAMGFWPKFSFRFISICLSDAHPRAGRHSHQS